MLNITDPLEMALAYAGHGWAVFPLHTAVDGVCDCRKACSPLQAGKHPRTMDGFKSATTDPEKIAHWWGMWPTANIGIATGKVSGIVVVDIDPRNGGLDTVDAIREKVPLFLPETARVRTQGGGWHLYYQYAAKRMKKAAGAGIDIKSDGGYVVAPPSVGASGAYVWVVAGELGTL